MIKSVQTGLASILNNVTGDYGTNYATNVTITAVDYSKCMLLLGTSFTSRINDVGIFNATIKLTSDTNLQISMPVRSPLGVALRWQVIEFY
jgi:hypothetical protein